MSDVFSHRVLIGGLILVLHLPLISLAFLMHGTLAPGQGLGDLGALAVLALLLFTSLPYGVLALLQIEWNPSRARLGEYDC